MTSDGIRVYASSVRPSKLVDSKLNNNDDDGISVYAAPSDTNYVVRVGPQNFDDIDTMCSFINKNNLLRSRCHHKHKDKIRISTMNNHIDFYTENKINPYDDKYNVDHIYEIQCFTYIVASALHNMDDDKGRALFAKLRDYLIRAINVPANLNITDKQTNLTKMNAFKVISIY